jgi:hypothetical protein
MGDVAHGRTARADNHDGARHPHRPTVFATRGGGAYGAQMPAPWHL